MNWSAVKEHLKTVGAVILFLIVFALFSRAFAAGPSATLSWTMATAYTNNAPIAAGAITATRINWMRHGQTAVVGTVDVPAPATTKIVQGLDCGQFDFTAQTLIGTTASIAAAAPVYDTKVECLPNPPGNPTAS